MKNKSRILLSKHFQLRKSQHQLDFVDIPLNDGDVPLFIDPYILSLRDDNWSIDCHNTIYNFFQKIINLIRNENFSEAKRFLSGLSEPNETRLGLSTSERPNGRGVGVKQSDQIFEALKNSSAVKTGFIERLEDCELMIEGISKDKISDITTNLIKSKLIKYTQEQCMLLNIRTDEVAISNIWDPQKETWQSKYEHLPCYKHFPIILVPKSITRRSLVFNHRNFYDIEILNYLQEEHFNSGSSLVQTLKSGVKKPPTKKILKEKYPLSKKMVFETASSKPKLIENYKSRIDRNFEEITNNKILEIIGSEQSSVCEQLIEGLTNISPGKKNANEYHDYVTGLLTFIFYPSLTAPQKEQEIDEGRKRIDIAFQNSALNGFFYEMHKIKKIPCTYIMFECKNYSDDISNPEFDQLCGRFSPNRGQLGFSISRKFEDKELIYKRCKDIVNAHRGRVIAFEDKDLVELIKMRDKEDFHQINKYLEDNYRKIVM